jgi:hypothetical protein
MHAAGAQAQGLEPATAEHEQQHEAGVGFEEQHRVAGDKRHRRSIRQREHPVDREHEAEQHEHEQDDKPARRRLRRLLVASETH